MRQRIVLSDRFIGEATGMANFKRVAFDYKVALLTA